MHIMTIAIIINSTHINGIIYDVIFPIRFMPPIMMSAIIIATTTPLTHLGILNPPLSVSAMVFICTIFMPKAANMQKIANNIASHFHPNPSLM